MGYFTRFVSISVSSQTGIHHAAFTMSMGEERFMLPILLQYNHDIFPKLVLKRRYKVAFTEEHIMYT